MAALAADMMVDEALGVGDEDMMDIGAPQDQPAPAPMVVGETTLDLEQYIAAYEGHNRRGRLMFIARRCPSLRIDALKTCVRDLRVTRRMPHEEVTVAVALSDACAEAGRAGEAEPVPGEAEVREAVVRLSQERDALEASLRTHRTNMVKESIRLGYAELGNHLYSVGDYTSAMKAFQRCRDYATAPKHVVEMCRAIIRVALEQRNWTHVHNHVNKAEGAGASEKDFPNLRTELLCASGLAHLAAQNFEQAAGCFIRADAEQCDLPHLVSRRDVAAYGALCALATFPRAELKRRVLENTGFKEFLELHPAVRETVRAFAASRYGACLAHMEELRSELLLDVHLSNHVAFLYKKIRDEMISQYFSPFISVDLNTMAADFGTGVEELTLELTELIAADKVQAKIDSDKQILHARQVDIRARTFKKALEVGNAYTIHTQAVLIRAAMLKAGMHVGGHGRDKPPSRRHPEGGMDMMNVDEMGMLG